MLSIRVADPIATLVAFDIVGRNPYEHIMVKNASLKLFFCYCEKICIEITNNVCK